MQDKENEKVNDLHHHSASPTALENT